MTAIVSSVWHGAGTCKIRHSTLLRRVTLSEHHVRKCLAQLVEQGFIAYTVAGRGNHKRYVFRINWLIGVAHEERMRGAEAEVEAALSDDAVVQEEVSAPALVPEPGPTSMATDDGPDGLSFFGPLREDDEPPRKLSDLVGELRPSSASVPDRTLLDDYRARLNDEGICGPFDAVARDPIELEAQRRVIEGECFMEMWEYIRLHMDSRVEANAISSIGETLGRMRTVYDEGRARVSVDAPGPEIKGIFARLANEAS